MTHHAGPVGTAVVWPVVAFIVAYNVVGNVLLPAWAYVPANLAALALAVAFVRRRGVGVDDLGVRRERFGSGVRVGLSAAGVIVIVLVLAAVIPAGREVLADERLDGVGLAGLAYHALFRIPLGTAVFEEVLFRGVLFGALLQVSSDRGAVVWSSVVFGLWHVLPTLDGLETNVAGEVFGEGVAVLGAVVLGVAVTSIAGAAFAWLRLRAGSVVAPILAHAALNSTAYTLGWLLVDRGWA